jgi:hypothetical protein
VGDLVWGLAHLESDGLSCDSTVGLRSTDVETIGNKPCEYPTGAMPSRPLPHRPWTHGWLGPTPAGGQAPDTRRRGSGVRDCPGGDRPQQPGSHLLKVASPDRHVAPGPVVVPGSSAPSAGHARAHQRVQAEERSAPGATGTPTLATPRARRQGRVGTGRTPRAPAGAPARIAAAARPLPRCDLCLHASAVTTSMPDHLTADRLSADSRRKL